MNDFRHALDAYAEATRAPSAARRRAPRPRRSLLAAAAVLALAAGGALWWPSAPPAPVARRLDDRGEADLGDAVHVRWDGSGAVEGDARDLRLAWEAGNLAVEVTPDEGVRLEVRTGEARIRVVGTGFDVRRDALGTAVSVRHGRVAVSCGDEPDERILGADEHTECLPVTPAALLGRARAQARRGDPPDAVLATLALADAGATGPVRPEIALLRASELVRADRPADALAVAEAALAGDEPGRRVDLLRLATRLAHDLGGCARAAAHTRALAALGEPTPCAPEAP